MTPQARSPNPYDAAELAARYADFLLGWWSPSGMKALLPHPGDLEREAEQRWDEEGGAQSL